MKKLLSLIITTCCCFYPLACIQAQTLKTISCFVGKDASSEAYSHLLMQWETQTSHTVIDHSATSDEAWKQGVLMDFAAGNEPDVFFFFACTTDSASLLDRVIPIEEINKAYPELHLPENPACKEKDGKIYAVPVRSFWEGLLCNTDLFEKYHLELPNTWEKLEKAITVFQENDIIPISVSLSDVPHYIAEFAISVCSTPDQYSQKPQSYSQVPESWLEGMKLIRRLYDLGAFPENVNTTSENTTSQLFRDKKAAMQIDGSWFANSLPKSNMSTTVVVPFPSYKNPQNPPLVIGGVSMGFYLSRHAWQNDNIRDIAVNLLAFLSTGENAHQLGGFQFSDKMLESALLLTQYPLHSPIQDQMSQEARSEWFRLIPDVASGTISPEEMWMQVMSLDPFMTP